MALTADLVYGDFIVNNVPSSGKKKPKKSEIRSLLGGYERSINSFLAAGGKIYATLAQLGGDLSPAQYSSAWVISDPTDSNNGIYQKIGAANTGSWIRLSDLPFSFIIASDVGAGTANAIQATTDIPVSESALIWLTAFRASTSSPVTVSFNGGSPLTIKTNSGQNVAAGAITAEMTVAGIKSGSDFRLISDIASAAIQAAAEAAAAAAAASAIEAAGYAALARNDYIPNAFAGNGATTVFALSADPGTEANAFVFIDGVKQALSTYSISGTTLTFTEAPPGNGIALNIEVLFGYKVGVAVPAALSVGSAAIKTSEAAGIRTAIDVPSNAAMTAAIAAAVANSVSGLRVANNATDAANDLDITAGSILSEDATTMLSLVAGVTKRCDATFAAGTNNGGNFDASVADGPIHVFVIGNGANTYVGTSALLVPTTAPNFPAGYKYKRIASIVRASGVNLAFHQYGNGRDRTILLDAPVVNINAVASQGTSAVTRTLTVPTGLSFVSIATYGIASNPGAGEDLYISSLSQVDVTPANGISQVRTVTSSRNYLVLEIPTNTSGQVRTRQVGGGSQEFLTISTRGWKDSI
ncbi:hypothetical protein J0664_06110 [Rhizobium leguminosarum]|uniref:hypothetical protein n=1 Tax=Rhizobium leguminosarum TaxID=384 RepID=UPI001A92F935|nr:hypothetical protein [Rhizobium leguminosarum]MBY5553715.1 hypothetical protein [Rhizobium leguminosarum]QSW24871.1 hypothetical protein J0664_06110 [Rhizobium leguminosarum]